MTIAERIKQKRLDRSLSQLELAIKIGMSRQAITKIESGTSVPSGVTILKLADFFHCTADELLGRRVS